MRRSDREVTDIDQIMEIVDQAKILHLGMFAEGYPYIVPLHYGYEYENGVLTFYLHSAGEGRKLDLIRANPNVCVELEANVELVSGHDIPCRYGAAFSSVIGTGKAEIVGDWLYVEDHCKAIDLILHKGTVGEVYNVGGHNEMTNLNIVKLILERLRKPESLITFVKDRAGHDMRYAIDPTKIHEELGWYPETMFASGIEKTIDWYLTHEDWWQNIISGEYQEYYKKMYENR